MRETADIVPNHGASAAGGNKTHLPGISNKTGDGISQNTDKTISLFDFLLEMYVYIHSAQPSLRYKKAKSTD